MCQKGEISQIFNSKIENVCTVEFASMYIMHVRCESKFSFTDHFNFLQRYLFIRHTNTNSDPNKKTNASVIVGKYVRNIFVTIGSGANLSLLHFI